MKNIKEIYPDDKILLMYHAGSKAFNTESKESDEDIVVVLEEFKGFDHIGYLDGNKEYFIFGKRAWLQKEEFYPNLPEYYKIYNEELLNEKALLCVDDEFKETYLKYKNRNWKDVMKVWLQNIIEYYGYFLNQGNVDKRMYHLFRTRAMLDHYDRTGSFSLEYEEPYKSKIMEFKVSPNKESYLTELKDLIAYFNEYAERME